jgi:ADP-ribosylglycohydrolase
MASGSLIIPTRDPAAYYLAARFHDEFESALLHAVNGGGQNQARAILVGALVGAQVGLAGIPQRFLAGLADAADLCRLVTALAHSVAPAEKESSYNLKEES